MSPVWSASTAALPHDFRKRISTGQWNVPPYYARIDRFTQLACPLYNITRNALVDLAMLVGTDFHEGVKNIGPKKALKLVTEFGSIEAMPSEIRDAVGPAAEGIRRVFLQPDVTENYTTEFTDPDVDGIMHFLCDEREFSRERVTAALKRAYKGI